MKDNVIEIQLNKINKYDQENKGLKKDIEKIKKENIQLKNNFINKQNSKSAVINGPNKKSTNINNNEKCELNSKSKLLKKTKTPTKINNSIKKTNTSSLTNNINEGKDVNNSNANNSIASKNSQNNKSEVLNATFRASKSSYNNTSNTNIANFNSKCSNTPNSNFNKKESLSPAKRIELKSSSKIINNNKNNNNNKFLKTTREKSQDQINARNSPTKTTREKLDQITNPIYSNNGSSMNITMKVNNINNFNNNFHANIISSSCESVKNDLVQRNNTLNDSFNKNNENLLKKMINMDFLGEKCNIISNSPINSPKIRYTTIQTEGSINNFSGGSPKKNSESNTKINNDYNSINMFQNNDDNNFSNLNTSFNNIQNKNNQSLNNLNSSEKKNIDYKERDSNYDNHKSYNFQGVKNHNKIKTPNRISYNSIPDLLDNPTNKKEKINKFSQANSDKLSQKNCIFGISNNEKNLENIFNDNEYNIEESTLSKNNKNNKNNLKTNHIHHLNNQKNYKNQINLTNNDDKKNTDRKKLSKIKEYNENYDISEQNSNENIQNRINNNLKDIRENSHDADSKYDGENSPCFMRDDPMPNNFGNSNDSDHRHTFNDFESNSKQIRYFPQHCYKNSSENDYIYDDHVHEGNNDLNSPKVSNNEKPKNLEFNKIARFSSSLPNKIITKIEHSKDKFEAIKENIEHSYYNQNRPINNFNNNPQIIKNLNKNVNKNNKLKKNLENSDLELIKHISNNSNNNSNYRNKTNDLNIISPKRYNNPLKNSNLNNITNQNNTKIEYSPLIIKKGHSNSIDFDQFNYLNNESNLYSNFANFNTSIKKRKLKLATDNNDSEILNTQYSLANRKLDISDITYQNTINKSDFQDYNEELEKFQVNTTRNISKPKKLIFVEKICENKDLKVINVDNSMKINKKHLNIEDESIQTSNSSKNLNNFSINNKKNKNNGFFNQNRNLNNYNEESIKQNFLNSLQNNSNNIDILKQKSSNIKFGKTEIDHNKPNLRESNLSKDLSIKCSTPKNNSLKTAYNFISLSKINNDEVKLNSSINKINDFKKKLQL